MVEKSSFFNAINIDGEWDRTYKAEDFARYFGTVLTNGIFPSPSTNLQVASNNDMNITVKAGSAFINGYMYHNDDDLLLNVDVADGTLKRIDLVVVRLDHNNRQIKSYVKKGSISSSPIPPTLTRDEFEYELCLAELYIEKGITSISQANIVDTRLNKNSCGIVSSLIEVDTEEIYSQLRVLLENRENEFVEWFSDLKANLESNVAANLQNQINNIEGELRLSTNSNYITLNQSKIFTSNNSGYATNMKLKGLTKILNADGIECNPWDTGAKVVSAGQGNNIELELSCGNNSNKTILPYTLRAIPNGSYDEIITEDGQDYLIKRCDEIIINGSEVITGPTQINTKTMRFDIDLNGILSNTQKSIISNKFAVGSAYDANSDFECIGNYNDSTLSIRLEKVRLSTWDVNTCKKVLKSNPITVVFERKTPLKIKIPKVNLNAYIGENILSINSGLAKIECEFNTTKTLASSIETIDKSLKSMTYISNDFYNYKNRRYDGVIDSKNISYLNTLNSGFYRLTNCSGFPYGWGQILLIKHDGVSYSIIYFNYEINMSNSGMYINTCQEGVFTGWQKINAASSSSLESRMLSLEQDNADLTFILMENGVI